MENTCYPDAAVSTYFLLEMSVLSPVAWIWRALWMVALHAAFDLMILFGDPGHVESLADSVSTNDEQCRPKQHVGIADG